MALKSAVPISGHGLSIRTVRLNLSGFDPRPEGDTIVIEVPVLLSPIDSFRDIARELGLTGRKAEELVERLAEAADNYIIGNMLTERINN